MGHAKPWTLLTSGSYFLTSGDPRKRKRGGLVDSGKTSMAFEFGPNPTVRTEVISTGENTPGTGKRQNAENDERGHIDFMALMCSRPKPRKTSSGEQTLSVGSFRP